MVSKVMLSAAADGTTGLRVAPLAPAEPVRTPPGSELHLGSQDIVRLTAFAADRGFIVSSFMISDAYLEPLAQDEQGTASDTMVDLLRRYGEEELEAALQNEYAGLYIVGVELIEPSSGMRISIRRRGYVYTSIVQEAEQLLKSAWQELRLS